MSTPASEALDRTATPWLFAAAAATTLPHVTHQAFWLSGSSLLMLLWALWLWRQDRRLPGRWLLVLFVAAACAGILAEYHTLFGRDAGVAMLVLFMAMKLLELKSRRDATVIVTLGYFLLLTHYLYSQSIATGLWLLASFWLLTATLIKLQAGSVLRSFATLRYAGQLCLQAVPLMVVLFILFPRISGPLWGLPSDAHAGRTGLSESMSPGSLSSLAQNGDIAFRVRFDGPVPPKSKLYWRGPVLDTFDGSQWTPAASRNAPPEVIAQSPDIDYELTLEPHNRRWLLALDAPRALPKDALLSSSLSVLSRQVVHERQRYRLSANLEYQLNIAESDEILRRNRMLPNGFNPEARALANGWRDEGLPAEEIIRRALAMFAKDFTYTLQPPLLGRHSVDEFLFRTKRGFCEHFAAAFVFLMRAANLPARVVTGYQGGELNPLDGYLTLRQSDAHAWAEVWLPQRGWTRFDPTSAVSPNRIETGIADALPSSEPLPALVQLRLDWVRDLRFRIEAMNNAWNQYILGYDTERQRALLSRLGWPEADWQLLGGMLGVCAVLCIAVLTAFAMWQRPDSDPAHQLWTKALRHLARRRVDFLPSETPLALLDRLQQAHPDLAVRFEPIVDAYLATRYGNHNQLNRLRDAVARLQ